MNYKCPSCKARLNLNNDYRVPGMISFSCATESSICSFVEVRFKDSKLCYLYFIPPRSMILLKNDPTKIVLQIEETSMRIDIDSSKYSENDIDTLFNYCMDMASKIKDNLSLM